MGYGENKKSEKDREDIGEIRNKKEKITELKLLYHMDLFCLPCPSDQGSPHTHTHTHTHAPKLPLVGFIEILVMLDPVTLWQIYMHLNSSDSLNQNSYLIMQSVLLAKCSKCSWVYLSSNV